MIGNKRPLSVTVLACLYLTLGAIGAASHLLELKAGHEFPSDALWAVLVQLSAIAAGAFMLRGHNWARWLALAWIAFHVVLSAFNAFHEFAIHALFCAVIGWLLFRSEARRYFGPAAVAPG